MEAPFSIGEPLVLAFLVGWLVRMSVAPGPTAGVPRREVLAPAIALAAVVAASVVVQLGAVQADIVRSGPAAATAFDFVISDYFRSRPAAGAIPAAALFLEGLGPLWLAAIPLIGAGLWLAGSRAALAAAASASVLLVPLARRAPRRLARNAALAVVLGLVVALPFAAGRLRACEEFTRPRRLFTVASDHEG